MAINEVKLNGQVLLTTRGDTVTKATLIEDETATNKAGEKIKGEAHIPEKVSELENDVPYAKKEDIPTKLSELENDTNFAQEDNTYLLTDSEGDIADDDYIPFNDVSDKDNPKKKTLFSDVVDNIKTKFLNVFWAVTGGAEIPANADLNNYKNVGNYIVNTTSIALTISNMPIKDAGRMIVVNTTAGTSYRTQLYYPYNANYNFTRHTVDGGLTWSNWITSYAGVQGDSHIHNYRNGLWWSQFKHKINGDKHLYLNFSKDGGATWDGDSKIPLMSDILPHTYEDGIAIPADSDLNDYKTAGVYTTTNDTIASSIANIPKSNVGKLIVSYSAPSHNYIQQIYIVAYNNEIYIRFYDNWNLIWKEWKQLASIDDISPANVGNGYAVATVSGSTITATISGFKLRAGVIVALRFNNEITVDSTLNISSTGAKSIKYWSDETISYGKSISYGLYSFIYDGTYYRIMTKDRVPTVGQQSYVADTSGNILIEWGYGTNRAQLKHNLSSNKLVFNYYKNSAWRGDYNIVDEYGRQTMSGWLGLKTNGGRTIASGAHSLAVSDTIPNILNELRFSNGAWGSFNLGTAYALNGITVPTGWYNYFYMPHRVGGENWATPTSWDADNVNYGTLLLFGMNNTNGMFRIRMGLSDDSATVVELNILSPTNYLRNDASSTMTVSGAPFLNIKSSTIDISQSNNNVSSTQYPAYIIQDKDGRDMARLETVVEPNGQIRTFIQVCNYNTNTSAHFRAGITMYTNKSQDMWYSFTNPHYVNAALGYGYAICDTAEATTAKVASLPRYIVSVNGYVTVRFANAVPANSTLNINSQGARPIYYHGNAIVNGVIRANDCATFIYSGGNYILVGIDRTNDITYSTTLSAGATQVTFTGLPTSGNYLNDIYTSKAGLNYKSLDDSTSGQLKVTFDAQTSAVTVYLKQEII